MRTMTPRRLLGMVAGLILLAQLSAGCQGRTEPATVSSSFREQTQPAAAEAAAPTAATNLEPTIAPSPTAVPTATPTVTPLPTSTPAPSATPTPAPSATPTLAPVPQAIQLTAGGCCTLPFWSPDSQEVRFIDKPAPEAPVGIYGVPVASPLSEPGLVTERIELSAAEAEYLVETTGNSTVIERLADGERWMVPAGGRDVLISPDRSRIAWTVSDSSVPSERRVATIWVANLDGSDARQVATQPRGGVSGWISDDVLLISGRESLQSREQALSALSLGDGSIVELVRADRLRGTELSPSGQWLVFYITFDADPERNGLWLVRTDGSQSIRLDSDLFGAYQWRGCPAGCSPEEERLVIVPFDPDAAFHAFWQLEPASGEVYPLTDLAVTPFKIANGDWRLSPDGRFAAYVESSDRNIWVLELPR